MSDKLLKNILVIFVKDYLLKACFINSKNIKNLRFPKK